MDKKPEQGRQVDIPQNASALKKETERLAGDLRSAMWRLRNESNIEHNYEFNEPERKVFQSR